VRCGDVCAHVLSDEAHCGACGVACTEYDECIGGRCATPIPCGSDDCYWPTSVCVREEPSGVLDGYTCAANTCDAGESCDVCVHCAPNDNCVPELDEHLVNCLPGSPESGAGGEGGAGPIAVGGFGDSGAGGG
jgi:hypothetical protein